MDMIYWSIFRKYEHQDLTYLLHGSDGIGTGLSYLLEVLILYKRKSPAFTEDLEIPFQSQKLLKLLLDSKKKWKAVSLQTSCVVPEIQISTLFKIKTTFVVGTV